MTGQTVAIEGRIAKICYNGRLVPICGRFFWDNNNGARLFCKMLGKKGGIVQKYEFKLTEDAYYAGTCSSTDKHITVCSAGKNKHTLGGKSNILGTGSCNKGSRAAIYIECDGKTSLLYFKCILVHQMFLKADK